MCSLVALLLPGLDVLSDAVSFGGFIAFLRSETRKNLRARLLIDDCFDVAPEVCTESVVESSSECRARDIAGSESSRVLEAPSGLDSAASGLEMSSGASSTSVEVARCISRREVLSFDDGTRVLGLTRELGCEVTGVVIEG